MTPVQSFFLPGSILFGIAFLFSLFGPPAICRGALDNVYPWTVLVAALLLGGRFTRSRLIFAVAVLTVADRGLLFVHTHPVAAEAQRIAIHAIAILLPINLTFHAMTKDGPLFRAKTAYRLAGLALQTAAVAILCRYPHTRICAGCAHAISALPAMPWIHLPYAANLLFLSALAALAYLFYRREGIIEAGFFWALLAAFAGLVGSQTGSLYFATAGLILVIAVTEDSYGMAFRDELTGLPARRALQDALNRLDAEYVLALVDVDHFKEFNDHYGHDVGDQVLRMIAARLAKVTGGGKVYRYGGEEFTVVFPDKGTKDVMTHLDELREGVASTRFVIRGVDRPRRKPKSPRPAKDSQEVVRITVSIGAAEPSTHRPTPQSVIEAADDALYRAKGAGRNRVSL